MKIEFYGKFIFYFQEPYTVLISLELLLAEGKIKMCTWMLIEKNKRFYLNKKSTVKTFDFMVNICMCRCGFLRNLINEPNIKCRLIYREHYIFFALLFVCVCMFLCLSVSFYFKFYFLASLRFKFDEAEILPSPIFNMCKLWMSHKQHTEKRLI